LSAWLILPNPAFIPKPNNGGISKDTGEFFSDGGWEKKVMAQERIDREKKRICPNDMSRARQKHSERKRKCPTSKGSEDEINFQEE
ncbi:hypothetical protein CEXT_490021, partial [Caerostris extrusa]